MIATMAISHPDRRPQATTTRRRFDNPPYVEATAKQAPLAGHALELVSAVVLELES